MTRLFSPEALLRIFAAHVYLGRVDGQLVYGFENAARAYFGKEELDEKEAALLAGMLRSPSYYSPLKHPERALARRDFVLARMHRQTAR